MNEWLIGEKISQSRNLRYAARLRGALAELRQEHGSSTVLLVPLFLPWRKDIAELLQTMPEIEENSSNKTSTDDMEEE
jgi:delta-aminolevulinic acid dehydratase/porphobilinogen synthase